MECLNKKIIELLVDGEIFDYNYISRRMDSIDVCYLCPGYNPDCIKYRPDNIKERFIMYFEGVING